MISSVSFCLLFYCKREKIAKKNNNYKMNYIHTTNGNVLSSTYIGITHSNKAKTMDLFYIPEEGNKIIVTADKEFLVIGKLTKPIGPQSTICRIS